MGHHERWVLGNLSETMEWCRLRNSQGIRCIIDILGEYALKENQATQSVNSYIETAEAIGRDGLNASLSIKLTALGSAFNTDLCWTNALAIMKEAKTQRIGFEMDMEGRDIVQFTIDMALKLTKEYPLTLALQAYLTRTQSDLRNILETSIRPRLVKGAYAGDVKDFTSIQSLLKQLVDLASIGCRPFSLGTHDPDVLRWIINRGDRLKKQLELGFLKGFADSTKLSLAKQGWAVAEYVPYGMNSHSYETRRIRYLAELGRLERKPAP